MTLRLPILLLGALGLCASAAARQPQLRFNAEGQFRIAQCTDLHLDPSTPYRLAQAEKTFARLDRVLAAERPDLIIFTGDVVTGRPAAPMWQRLLDTLARRGVPFCVVLGNHDAEQDLSRPQIARLVTASPLSLNTLDARGELADRSLTVAAHGSSDPAAAIYCLDAHDYSTLPSVEGYGWFTPEQVAWLRHDCTARTVARGGRPLPALAFFHIPLPEYASAWRNPANGRIGRAAEEECPGALNTGMRAALVEPGSILGAFAGHDHDIDYLVCEYGTVLGYGRFSGDDTTYNNLRPGVRIIELDEGARAFTTWIREDDGRTVDAARLSGGTLTEIDLQP